MSGLTVGFIGAGWIVEKVYLPYFSGLDPAAIWAYEPNRRRLVALRERYPALRAQPLAALCGPAGPDLVVVASPNHAHADHVVAALEGGRRVLCEKPLCVTPAGCETIERALRRTGGVLDTSLPNRFRDDVAKARELVRAGTIGAVRHISARWVRRSGVPATGWHLDRRLAGGGVLMDLGPHLVDAVCWIAGLGSPGVVTCRSKPVAPGSVQQASWYDATGERSFQPDVEGHVVLRLSLPECACDMELAWAGDYVSDVTEIVVDGTRGQVTLRGLFGFSQDTPLTASTVRLETPGGSRAWSFPLDPKEVPFFRMFRAIVRDLARGGTGVVDPAMPLHTVRAIHAAYDEDRRAAGSLPGPERRSLFADGS